MRMLGITVLVTLVLAAVAAANTNSLHGDFKGDANATISVKIVVKHDRPVMAKAVRVTNLDYACRISGETGEMSVDLGSFPIHSKGGSYEFDHVVDVDGVEWRAGGIMRKSGDKVRGIVFYNFPTPEDQFCSSKPGGSVYVAK